MPSGSCIKHLSDSVGNCSEVMSVKLQPCQFFQGMAKPGCLCWEKIYFTSKTRKRHHPSFPLSQDCRCRNCFPVLTLETESYFLEKGWGMFFFSVYLFAFVLYQCIINVEHLTLNSACNNKRNSASKLYVHTTTYTRHRSYVFIWTYSCQHTQARFFILGCLCTL